MWLRRELMRTVGFVLKHLTFNKRCSLSRTLLLIIFMSAVTSVILLYSVMDSSTRVQRANPPVPHIHCISGTAAAREQIETSGKRNGEQRQRIAHRALLISESPSSKGSQKIRLFLSSLRIDVKVELKSKTLPTLANRKSGRFAVVIFENYNSYLELDNWNRQLIDKYCHDYGVGIIGFVKPPDEWVGSFSHFESYFMTFQYNLKLEDYKLRHDSDIWRVTKPGDTWRGLLPDTWTVFHTNHTTYQSLAFSKLSSDFLEFDTGEVIDSSFKYVTAVHDQGQIDGIPKILMGCDLNFWLHSLMFMDALSYLSFGKLELTLDRYLQVDVDDIFVGKTGIRMKIADVQAMLETQRRISRKVEGFQFNLGFSGGFYLSGDDEEDKGDKELLDNRNSFRWFSHMFKHEQPHRFDPAYIANSMKLNKKFAEDYNIGVYGMYAVAPHHSGVFPVYEPLYTSWKSIWGVMVTSTEEYPKLLPAWKRRGFIHRGIMVLPRQTCGLFTTTVFSSDFRGGLQGLDTSIQGGEIFQTILTTPISIFMTHLSNYGNDQLALYMLESVTEFLRCWTNFRLLSLPPLEMGFKYFEMYPTDKDPLWTNPCDYGRHLSIWPANRTCDRLPQFLIVGPQKTGTTALYSFLSQHPSLVQNLPSPKTFEEIQFFNTDNYYTGLDWYMDFFPAPEKPNVTMLYEKSANYFENDIVPKRIASLLPRAKIIVILMNPARRAYSWYQHQRTHKDSTALNYTFHEVVTANDMSPPKLRALRSRCLQPGLYAQHLLRWRDFFPSTQIHIVHSDELRNDPINVLHYLQKFLHVSPYIDYSQYLRYDPVKGFFCQVLNDKQNKCLGKSKGHNYPPMDSQSELHLRRFYRKHNSNLSKLLSSFNTEVPEWLHSELKENIS